MTNRRHCDNCDANVTEVYLCTDENARWVKAEQIRPYGDKGGYTTDRLDFCGWNCMASYAISKALDPETADD